MEQLQQPFISSSLRSGSSQEQRQSVEKVSRPSYSPSTSPLYIPNLLRETYTYPTCIQPLHPATLSPYKPLLPHFQLDFEKTTPHYLCVQLIPNQGNWKKNLPLARDPEEKTLGIIGLGGIGKVTARRMALGWGMKVLYHNRREVDTKDLDFKVEYKKDLMDLLKESDVVSIHLPVSSYPTLASQAYGCGGGLVGW
jgi:hypothetical protein